MRDLKIDGMEQQDYKKRETEYSVYEWAIYKSLERYTLELDARTDKETGITYWANGIFTDNSTSFKVNLYSFHTSMIDLETAQLGVNWQAMGTQTADTASAYANLLVVASEVVKQINKQLREAKK